MALFVSLFFRLKGSEINGRLGYQRIASNDI